jgi:cytochrome P450
MIAHVHQLFWDYAHEGYQKFGSIFKFAFPGIGAVLISDPDFAKFFAINHDKYFEKFIPRTAAMRKIIGTNIFNAVEDDIWKRHRLILNPAFSDDAMAVVGGTFNIVYFKYLLDETLNSTLKYMNEIDKNPNRFNVIQDFSNLTLNGNSIFHFVNKLVIGTAGFGYDFNAFSKESQENPDSVMNAQARVFVNGATYSYFPPMMRNWKFIPFLKQFHKDVNTFKDSIGDIIDHRMKEEDIEQRRDILSLLISAAKGVDQQADDELKPLTKQEMISDCIVFIVAGHETVSS